MAGYIGQAPGHGQIQYFTFTATAGQTTFTGVDDNKYVLNYSAGFCDVFLNGRRLTPTSDYTATDGSTITLQSATSLNDVIFVASASTFDTADWVTNAVNYVYTATAGQTTFTGSDDNSQTLSYVNGTILVSVNGINIPQSDYTATNGTSVVLNSGVNVGDIVQIFSLRTMAVVNFLPLTGGTVTGTITVGNSSVNTQITAGNIALNGSTLLIGNSTSNVVLTGTTLTISNSTSNVSIGPGPASINAIATNTFTVGNTLYVVSNGNVGLGSNAPSSKLDLYTNTKSGVHTPLTFSANNSNNVKRDYAKIGFSVEQNLAGAEAGGIQFKVLRSNTEITAGGFFGATGAQYWSFSTEASERMRITSNGNIGIGGTSGVTTPKAKLHVAGSGTETPLAALGSISSNASVYITNQDTAYGLIVASDGSGRTYLQSQRTDGSATAYDICLNPLGGYVGIGTTAPTFKFDLRGGRAQFSPSSEAFAISLRYNDSTNGVWIGSPAANSFQISRAGGDAVLNIDGSGRTGIACTAPEALLDLGGSITATNTVYSILARPSGGDGNFKLTTCTGSGTTINSEFCRLSFKYGSATTYHNSGIGFYRGADVTGGFMTFHSDAWTERMRIGVNGVESIQFAATQVANTNANTLDDYEEGTWTPIIGGVTSESGQSYDVRTANYTKIGRMVYASFDLRFTAKGTITGTVRIKGLPFTSTDWGTGYISYYNNSGGTNYYWMTLSIGGSSSGADLNGITGAMNYLTSVNGSDLTNTSRFQGMIIYPA